jgi:hypothetical protein
MPIDKFAFRQFYLLYQNESQMYEFVLISLHFILIDLNDATKKQAKLLVFSKEAHKLISNFNM